MSRWRDPQLQMSKNYDKMEVNDFAIYLAGVTFYI